MMMIIIFIEETFSHSDFQKGPQLKDDLLFRDLLSLIFFEVVGWSRFFKFENVVLLSNVPSVQRNLYTIKFNLRCTKADRSAITAYTNKDLALSDTHYVFYTDYYLYPLHNEVKIMDLFPSDYKNIRLIQLSADCSGITSLFKILVKLALIEK